MEGKILSPMQLSNRMHTIASIKMMRQSRWQGIAVIFASRWPRPDSLPKNLIASEYASTPLKYLMPEYQELDLRIWFFESENDAEAVMKKYACVSRVDLDLLRLRYKSYKG
jgi:hypothetical protein